MTTIKKIIHSLALASFFFSSYPLLSASREECAQCHLDNIELRLEDGHKKAGEVNAVNEAEKERVKQIAKDMSNELDTARASLEAFQNNAG